MTTPIDPYANNIEVLAEMYERIHDSVSEWNCPASVANKISDICEKVVEILIQTPGMTQAHSRDFKRATPLFTFQDGSVLKTWKNPVGVDHVFIANSDGEMVFGGFVGWIHSADLQISISEIRQKFV